ncbi:hypothetical protein, partial [uncultured Limnohabitans sp.]|uniref:hypothetical protein n=1 Tax=uncultured Limnohabitans sp. TaxID=768543 RepID=UPI00260F6EF2
MHPSAAVSEVENPSNLAPSRFFWGLAWVAAGVIAALVVATTVQWRQAQALEAAARLQEDSMSAIITNLEREMWRFDAAMVRLDAPPETMSMERSMRFDILF